MRCVMCEGDGWQQVHLYLYLYLCYFRFYLADQLFISLAVVYKSRPFRSMNSTSLSQNTSASMIRALGRAWGTTLRKSSLSSC